MDGNLQLLVLLYELYEFDSPNLLQSFGHIHCVFLVFLITEDKQHRQINRNALIIKNTAYDAGGAAEPKMEHGWNHFTLILEQFLKLQFWDVIM